MRLTGSYARLFRNRNFALFQGGLTVSNVGDNISWIVLAWLARDLGGSMTAVGAVLAAYTAPGLLSGFAAGVLLDRFDRRTLLIADNAVRGAVFLLLPIVGWFGSLRVWHLVLAAAVHGTFSVLTISGGPAIVAGLVDESLRSTANAFESLGYAGGEIGGRLLAGVLIAFFPPLSLILLDCFSYLVFAACLLKLPAMPPDRERHSSIRESLGGGFSFLLGNRLLRATTVSFVFANIGAGSVAVLAASRAASLPHAKGGQAFGLLMAALSLGQCLGALVAGAAHFRQPLGRLVALALAFSAIPLAIVSVNPRPAAAAILFFLFGALIAPVNVWIQTIRMAVIPPALRGRLFAIIRTLIRATLPASAALAAFLVDRIGPGPATALMALCVALPAIAALATRAFEERSPGAPGGVQPEGLGRPARWRARVSRASEAAEHSDCSASRPGGLNEAEHRNARPPEETIEPCTPKPT